MERKLELADIVAYLPYGLEFITEFDEKITASGFHKDFILSEIPSGSEPAVDLVDQSKPILRPMSDLTKSMMIDGLESTPMERICDKYPYARVEFMYGSIYLYRDMETKCHSHEIVLQWEDYDLLNRLHFDWRHDLIGQGLAIDINTLKD